jgi:hypothetical protein
VVSAWHDETRDVAEKWRHAAVELRRWLDGWDPVDEEFRPDTRALLAAIRYAETAAAHPTFKGKTLLPPALVAPTPLGTIAIEVDQGERTHVLQFDGSEFFKRFTSPPTREGDRLPLVPLDVYYCRPDVV